MKWLFLLAITAIALISSCGNGDDRRTAADSANTLTDTMPAHPRLDSMALDSNAPDATRIDSLRR